MPVMPSIMDNETTNTPDEGLAYSKPIKNLVNQLSSSTAPTYVRSVRRTLTAPLSQLAARILTRSPLPMISVLLADGQDPAPSSKSVQGSTSKSLSCCFDFPEVVVLDDGTRFL